MAPRKRAAAALPPPELVETGIAPLSMLVPAPYNPRKIDKAARRALRKSIETFGLVQPLVVNRRTMHVVGGHQRLAELKSLGYSESPVVWVDLDDANEKALNVTLNSTYVSGEFDNDLLADLLRDLQSTPSIPFEALRLDDLQLDMPRLHLAGDDEPEDDDETPELPEVPESQRGAVYQLGPHRLVCGDCTEEGALSLALDGRRAALLFTDPPYNVAADTSMLNASVRAAARDLKAAAWDVGFRPEAFGVAVLPHLADDVTAYVCTSHQLFGAWSAWAKTWADFDGVCGWVKPNPMPSLAKRHWTWNFELVAYATRGAHTFNFPAEGHATSAWEIGRSARTSSHPTEKPVAVPAHAIAHSSKPGDLVLDAFGGSGSTLVACAQLDRVAAVVEIDPRWCDVIRRRWTRWAAENDRDPGSGALPERTTP